MPSTLTSTGITFSDGTSQNTAAGGDASKAWLSYNGDTATVRDSFNVSSVTDNGTGDYTTNIDNDMANASYAVSGAISAAGTVNSNVNIFQIHSSAANTLAAPSTSAFRAMSIHDANDVKQDVDYFTVIVHGDAA